MTLREFQESVEHAAPPAALGAPLVGLWWDAKGDWARAHDSAQQDEGPGGAWVHAYLHRKVGEISNAEWWYGQAGKKPSKASLDDEWREISTVLLGSSKSADR